MPAAMWSPDEIGIAGGVAPHRAEAFELTTLLWRCMGDRLVAASLVDTFTARLAGIVENLERLLTEKNWTLAGAKAHELKGEAGSLAAIDLQTAARLLEECLRTGCVEEAPSHFLPLKLAADECIQARSDTLEHLGASASDLFGLS